VAETGASLMVVLPRRWTRYATAVANLEIAKGERLDPAVARDVVWRMWRHLFLLVAEILCLPRRLRLENITDTIRFRNKPDVVRAFSSGRPVMVLSGHYGNWEMAVSVFGLFGYRMGVVARTLDNPWLNRWFEDFRGATGHIPFAKKGGYDQMLGTLQRGGHLALLGDQDAGSGGVFVDYFGRPASTHKSIALLAFEYDALICVGYARRLEEDRLASGWNRFELGCEEVVDPRDCADAEDPVRSLTQRYTSALERAVRRSPEQYFWVHRRWKSVPKVRGRKARAAA
jgi:KDO2-lipid IV(A) lauroyltransferase